MMILLFISSTALILPLLPASLTDNAAPYRRAYACEVGLPQPQSEEFNNSVAVFSGTVAKIQKLTLAGASDRLAVSFDVDRYWKSPNPNENDNDYYKNLIIITSMDSGGCGYDFEAGKTYLVYARMAWPVDGYLYTSLGSRTRPIENAGQDLAVLGEGTIPTKQASWDQQIARITSHPIPAGQGEQMTITTLLPTIGIGVAIAGAAAFFSLRRLGEKKTK